MNDFKPGDLIYYVFSNGDKAPCIVQMVKDEHMVWVQWTKDGLINLMPKERFVKDE